MKPCSALVLLLATAVLTDAAQRRQPAVRIATDPVYAVSTPVPWTNGGHPVLQGAIVILLVPPNPAPRPTHTHSPHDPGWDAEARARNDG